MVPWPKQDQTLALPSVRLPGPPGCKTLSSISLLEVLVAMGDALHPLFVPHFHLTKFGPCQRTNPRLLVAQLPPLLWTLRLLTPRREHIYGTGITPRRPIFHSGESRCLRHIQVRLPPRPPPTAPRWRVLCPLNQCQRRGALLGRNFPSPMHLALHFEPHQG